MSDITAVVHYEDDQKTAVVEVRSEADGYNRLVGFATITLVPSGARVRGTNGLDDSDSDGQIILHAEKRDGA